MWIRPLADADGWCGAKAIGLARLIAAGLRVPDGFVLDSRAFHQVAGLGSTGEVTGKAGSAVEVPAARDAAALIEPLAPGAIGHALAEAGERFAHAQVPAEIDREVRARAAALGRLAVRSSASIEDGVLGSAAGVFASVTDVAPEDVWDAVRTVWTSALTPLAVAYARRRAAAIAIAVIVQRFVAGTRMTVYTRPAGTLEPAMEPGDEDMWLSRDGAIERVRRSAAMARPDAAIALAAEAAIGAVRGADVELVLEPTPHGARPWVVQARPIVHSPRRRRLPPPAIVLAPLTQDGRRWTWDIAHNPDPLSPAQAGLVEAVDRAEGSPYALRVCGGYLYTAPRLPRHAPAPPADAAELASRIAAIEARFVLGEALTVAEAVARYVAFTRIWACELSPLVAAARARLLDRLARAGHPPEQAPALAASLIGPRRVLRDPVMSPAWDIAVPTFAERLASAACGGEQLVGQPPGEPLGPPLGRSSEPPHELAVEVELARAAADAAEHDDLWFARAQWLVRRALLARSAALGLQRDDIFWLPLEEVVSLRTIDPDDAHRRASAARAAHARAAAWDMPLVVHGAVHGHDIPGELDQSRAGPKALRGVGIGPRVVGRAVRLASLGAVAPIGRGDVVVARAITPALAMFVEGCAALVSETGGLLDHGAALARELGITCVVGCAGAWTQLGNGTLVSVDGDAGLVEPM
jgi:pyruvate,water dikinase